MAPPLRALFLTDGIDVPASRFRAEQFFPHLERRGIDCTLRYAYGPDYNRLLGTRWARPYQVVSRARRAAWTIAGPAYDVLFLQRTAFPQFAYPERIAASLGVPLVLDFDDAIYRTPDGPSRLRQNCFDDAIAAATLIIAGNDHLASLTGRPERTRVIPTVIDTDLFPEMPLDERETVTIGWMGTSGNFPALRTILPPILSVLRERTNARFTIVSNATLDDVANHPQIVQRRWSRETELADLASFDIGVMPLEDTEWNRGKCGFKMIQYMAVGRPVVSSRVGANVAILQGSGGGTFAKCAGAWAGELMGLVDSYDRRVVMGAAARRHAVDHYSVTSRVDDLADVLTLASVRSGAARPGS